MKVTIQQQEREDDQKMTNVDSLQVDDEHHIWTSPRKSRSYNGMVSDSLQVTVFTTN
jgi:hypothetical protein